MEHAVQKWIRWVNQHNVGKFVPGVEVVNDVMKVSKYHIGLKGYASIVNIETPVKNSDIWLKVARWIQSTWHMAKLWDESKTERMPISVGLLGWYNEWRTVLEYMAWFVDEDWWKTVDESLMCGPSSGVAVIVEPRNHPFLKHVVRNASRMLGKGWKIVVYSNSENWDDYHGWFVDGCDWEWVEFKNEGIEEYNKLFLSEEFWEKLKGVSDNVMVFQTDSLFLRPLLREDLDQWVSDGFGFIGGCCNSTVKAYSSITLNRHIVNGGCSFRRASKMIKACQKVKSDSVKLLGTAAKNEDLLLWTALEDGEKYDKASYGCKWFINSLDDNCPTTCGSNTLAIHGLWFDFLISSVIKGELAADEVDFHVYKSYAFDGYESEIGFLNTWLLTIRNFMKVPESDKQRTLIEWIDSYAKSSAVSSDELLILSSDEINERKMAFLKKISIMVLNNHMGVAGWIVKQHFNGGWFEVNLYKNEFLTESFKETILSMFSHLDTGGGGAAGSGEVSVSKSSDELVEEVIEKPSLMIEEVKEKDGTKETKEMKETETYGTKETKETKESRTLLEEKILKARRDAMDRARMGGAEESGKEED